MSGDLNNDLKINGILLSFKKEEEGGSDLDFMKKKRG